jgi:hypothetical protein
MLKKIITKTRIKILLIVLVSFLVVEKGTSQVFLVDSPRVNPEFIARIKNAPTELAQLPANLFFGIANLNPFSKKENDMFANVKSVTPPPNVAFKQIAKGVFAAEDPKTGQKYIKIEAGTKYRIVGTVTINGKQYPKIEFVE